jgi:C-terminal processing protease CtpA/Prc
MEIKKGLNFIWVVINSILGFVLGWLIAFGFLNLDNQFIVIFIGVISAVLHGYFWFRILSGKKQHLKIKRIFLGIQIIIVTLIAGLYFSQRLTYQNSPIIGNNYEKSFTKLWQAMDEVYPYFELKGIDWNQTYEKYHPLVLDVANDQEYLLVIAHMLGELKDAHTDIIAPNLDKRLYASVGNLGDLAIIDQIGYSAEMAGLRSGMVVLKIAGKPIEELVPEIDISLNEASTPWARKIRAYNQLLAVPEDENVKLIVTVMDKNGKEIEVEIKQLSAPSGWVSAFNIQKTQSVSWEKKNEDVGYIRIDRLWNNDDDVVNEFDLALNKLMDTQGIILDLRQNGGGDSRIAERIAGRFLDKNFTYGYEEFRKRIYKFAWRKSVNYSVKPMGDIYQGKLVVLTDYPVMSSAEWLVGALIDSGRAISIGRVTGGSTGNPIQFALPGGKMRYSTAAFYRPDGRLVEGQGYSPEISVNWTIEDYINGIDPDIQAALDWMEAQE